MAAKNIYLFSGDDFLSRRRMLRGWIHAFEQKYGDINITMYDMAKTPPLSEMTASLFAMPFLAEKRCVVFRGFPFSSTQKVTEELEEIETLLMSCLERLGENTIVLLDAENPDRRRKATKKLLTLAEEKSFILKEGMSSGDADAAKHFPEVLQALLRERLPHSIGSAAHDLEKLALLQDSRPLTREDVEILVPVRLEQDAFLLTRAMMERDAETLFRGMMRLKSTNAEILMFMGLLVWQLEQVILVQDALAHGLSDQAIAKELGIKPFVLTQAKRYAKAVSATFLQGLLEDLVAMDVMLKTGGSTVGDPASFDTLASMLYQRIRAEKSA